MLIHFIAKLVGVKKFDYFKVGSVKNIQILILQIIKEMQELGHPPKEIVGDGNGGGGLPLGGAGFPGAEQCVIS